MRKVLLIALLFFSCGQQETDSRSPYDLASQQQLSYLSKCSNFRDSIHSPDTARTSAVHRNYQHWATKYWKDNPKVERWLLQVKEVNSDDTAAFFTLVDYSMPISFVSTVNTNSSLYNTIKAVHENAYVLATGTIKSNPSFANTSDTALQRMYLDAVFDTLEEMNYKAQ
jgi:hypothetical protein